MTAGSAPEVLPAATRRPQSAVPPRASGSIRRSSHIGVRSEAELFVHGAVRDVVSDDDGQGRVIGEASLDCVLAADRTVTSIVARPAEPALSALVGRVAHRGWRSLSREVVAGDSLLMSLLDDVPIALLLSSYGALRQGALDMATVQPLMRRMRNLCAGWAQDATPMRTMDAGLPMPLPGVVVVTADDAPDPLATEPRAPLVPGEVRRTRRLDVVPGPPIAVRADFRDTWCDRDGQVGALHEYVVTATLSDTGVVESIEADPRVLPYDECTFAAASPQRLVGRQIGDVAAELRADKGTATCTHLDDLLRTLSVVPSLLGW